MNARIALHNLLLVLFVLAVPAFVADRVADALDTSEATQSVMQASLPIGPAGDAAPGTPAFDIEAVTPRDEVSFEVRMAEVVVSAADLPA